MVFTKRRYLRQEAKNRGLSLSEFEKICAEDESVDRSLDEIWKNHILDSVGLMSWKVGCADGGHTISMLIV